ncbi:murein hydrolase activator EnvC family protein [Nitritalea halalkaliphila]|uniref:murein hydrolase activator EnvC family protein n=1 Tax=Nitritalea halalkaliphila TaxID=590849 RepID=UPI0002F1CB81|nr:hypothetical protein [Nitritalea halalkaliphila]
MPQRFFLLLFLFLLIGTPDLLAQSGSTSRTRAQLEREKEELQKRISEFDRILQRTTASRQASISELNLVNQKLQARLSLINNLNKEINLINAEVREKESRIQELEKELKALKEEYARMIYYSAKLNQGRTLTAFIFSSNSVKQLFLRLNYLRQYAAARKRQVARMESLSAELKEQKAAIEQRLEQRKLVLKEEEAQRKALADAKKEQERMVASLRQQEDKIKKDLAAPKNSRKA